MVALKIRIFISSRLRGLVNNTITSTSRQGGPDPPAGASRRHAPLPAAGPSLPHRPDPVLLVGPSPPCRPDPVPLLLSGPVGPVGGSNSSSSRILTSLISPIFPGKRQGLGFQNRNFRPDSVRSVDLDPDPYAESGSGSRC
jgi:hypothetical protein